MVKLKIIARVIPEDTYLAAVESSQSRNIPIRGEKKFFVIIRDPEEWYIGTLALEIKKRYQSLYKHDLGQIKYIKDNVDDCDLDPELYVADALLDEGKVLTDPSDQQATIKVIQEQGRAIRFGSVVPDLSQVHYQLPERPARPPIPNFQDVGSALGKRKLEENVPKVNLNKKRMRLDEIEEEDLIASIEDQPARSEVMVAASQAPVPRSSREIDVPILPEHTWSFNGVGPPVLIEADTKSEQVGQDSIPQQPSEIEIARTDTVRDRTPNILSRATPETNGSPVSSPLAAASSASKKFLMPRKDVFKNGDLDIDDSQMSPNSRDTSRITPRLVHSVKAHKVQMDSSRKDLDAIEKSSPTFSTRLTNVFDQGSSQHREKVTSPRAATTEGSDSDDLDSDTSMKAMEKISVIKHAGLMTSTERATITTSVAAKSSQSLESLALTSAGLNGLSHGVDGSLSDASLTSSKSVTKSQSSKRKRKRHRPRKSQNEEVQTPSSTRQSHTAVTGRDDLSTPGADSASEQLFQTLQESARKSVGAKPVFQAEGTEQANKPPKMVGSNTVASKVKTKDRTGLPAVSKVAVPVPHSSTDTASEVNRAEIDGGHVTTHKFTGTRHPAMHASDQTLRGSSTDSRVASSYKTVLPLGMTQEQYDEIVKGKAYYVPETKPTSKKRSTPSIRQGSTPITYSQTATLSQTKQTTPTPSSTSKVSSSTAAKKTSKALASNSSKPLPQPPSSISVTKSSVISTPTPTPKAQSKAVNAKALTSSNPTPRINKTSTASSKVCTVHPIVTPTFSSARNLQELRAMASSANTSRTNSPGLGSRTSGFVPPQKTLLNNDDTDDTDDSSASDSDSSSTATPPVSKARKAEAIATSAAALSSNSKQKPNGKRAVKHSSTSATSKSRPDPTIRDATTDESSSENEEEVEGDE